MNIPVSAMIVKMEEELRKAKGAESAHELKARILVVRSLCDVILDQEDKSADIKAEKGIGRGDEITPLELEKMMGIFPKKDDDRLQVKERFLEEEDANGESIFDF